jgi:hypothetical protein
MYNGPEVVRSWRIGYSRVFPTLVATSKASLSRLLPTTSRYEDDGAQRIIDAAAEAVAKLKSLPAGEKERFAARTIEVTAKLGERADQLITRQKAIPIELPDPLP